MTTTHWMRDDLDRDGLLAAPLDELCELANGIRDRAHGTRITYSPKVFIPLTMLCRDRCGYCTFAKPPARLASPYLSPDEVLAIAERGAATGCHEALFTLGERPELRYPVAEKWLSDRGYGSTVEYLAAMAEMVLDKTGLLPHTNAGALYPSELAELRRVSASQGMMIESLAELDCHRASPDKTAARRLDTLEAAGELHIPFTTGVLVGIGESRPDRIEALETIAASHGRHRHVQEVIVQNFLPKPGTAMHSAPACPPEELLWTIAVARVILPPEIHLQAPPNLSDDFGVLLGAGIDDWGGVSPVTADHVNPERAWPAVERLRSVTEGRGFSLAPRLPIYPEFALSPGTWLEDRMRFPVLDMSDAEGLGRDAAWCSGGDVAPPRIVGPGERRSRVLRGPVAAVLAGVLAGQDPGEQELVTLFGARGPEVRLVAEAADELRRQVSGEVVTYVANRNINYTNVCTFKCRF
ncbi:MAG TPA: 7,8-didemethyl-8-hydroxy-5-deazariboflavin synthase CofG, partial [Acidimicrobiales bacterium]|nr:7,8-didemethyl-8-hydroxy-5-deazariboflavin synthase CofG [Acidimicrobiales bacterium]